MANRMIDRPMRRKLAREEEGGVILFAAPQRATPQKAHLAEGTPQNHNAPFGGDPLRHPMQDAPARVR